MQSGTRLFTRCLPDEVCANSTTREFLGRNLRKINIIRPPCRTGRHPPHPTSARSRILPPSSRCPRNISARHIFTQNGSTTPVGNRTRPERQHLGFATEKQ